MQQEQEEESESEPKPEEEGGEEEVPEPLDPAEIIYT